MTDFTPLVATIGSDVDVVFLPWQIAANAQLFGQQLREQGKRAVIFGSDGLDSGDFRIAGSYVTAFAPDIRGIKGNAAFIKGYGARFVSNFGPPVYVATQAAIAAIQEGLRGRRRHPGRGAEAPEGDVHPEDRPRRQPPLHRPR